MTSHPERSDDDDDDDEHWLVNKSPLRQETQRPTMTVSCNVSFYDPWSVSDCGLSTVASVTVRTLDLRSRGHWFNDRSARYQMVTTWMGD